MAPKKRARSAASPSSSSTAEPKITLSGGEPHHSSLVALWHKEKLTDIAVCAEGTEFKAHRAALASGSGYFLSLFDSGMRDAANPIHVIEGLSSSVLKALLAFVYEGSCEVEAGLLTEMLDAAARLVVDPLKAACACAIQAQLGPCNALDVWRLADLYTLPALEKAAITCALGGFEELPLQSASGAQVLTLVQEDRLVAKNEEAVFRWVVRWWEAGERPEAELLAVMKHVRFAAMDAGFVQATVRAWPALRLSIVFDLGIVFDSFQEAGRALPRFGFAPRLVYVLGGTVAFGGGGGGKGLSTVEVYDPRTDAWKHVSSMPTYRHMHGAAAHDGKIYALGGLGPDGDLLSTADVYDPQSDQWQPLAEMATARANLAAVGAGGKIYAVGGEDDSGNSMATVEAFDPLLGAWAKVASMSVIRCNHAVTVVDGRIYAIGGLGVDAEFVDTIDVYDPQADSWQEMTTSIIPLRYSHAAAAIDSNIYISGGMDEHCECTSTLGSWSSTRRPTRGLSWQAWARLGIAMPLQ